MRPGTLAKKALEKGTTTEDKGVYIPREKRLPKDPANLNRSKEEFQAAQKQRRDRELRHKELDEQLEKVDAGAEAKIEAPKEEVKIEKKVPKKVVKDSKK